MHVNDLAQAAAFLDECARANSPTGELRRTLPDDWRPEVDHTKHHGFNGHAFAQCEECALRKLRKALLIPAYMPTGASAQRQRDIREKAGLPT